jgi:hypothetical protein
VRVALKQASRGRINSPPKIAMATKSWDA